MNKILTSASTESTALGPMAILPFLLVIVTLLVLVIKNRKKLLQHKSLIGGIFSAIGGGLTIYGVIQRDTMEYKLASLFGSEEAKTIDTIFYIGIAVLIVGAIFIVAHLTRKEH